MNARERVLRTIKFEYPDRVPLTHSQLSGAVLRHGKKLIELYKKYPNDFFDIEGFIKIPEKDVQHYRPDGSYFKEETDEWGCVWTYHQEGLLGEVKKSPLDNWSKLKGYKFPPVANSSVEERKKMRETMKRTKERFVGWGRAGELYERMQWLRGVENLMIDIGMDGNEVYALAKMMLQKCLIPKIELALEAGADVIGFADDWGAQDRLLINPKSWRKIFKPRYKEMFDLVHQGGAITSMHSDGMILEILPDLIEIGLDVINPQFSCMNLKRLREITSQKICILADIDRQKILPFGSPEDVRANVKKIFDIFLIPEGGFIARGEIGPDVPLKNVKAMLKAFYEFGDLSPNKKRP